MNEDTRTDIHIPPVTKSISVNLDVEDAFKLFTRGIGTWWPIHTHSVGEERAVTCRLEGRVGGRLYEIQDDGTEAIWGTISSWEPPQRLVFSWHPGYDPAQAQEVEVSFQPEADGTRLVLVHRGWEQRTQPEAARQRYDSGWELVLGRYISQAKSLEAD